MTLTEQRETAIDWLASVAVLGLQGISFFSSQESAHAVAMGVTIIGFVCFLVALKRIAVSRDRSRLLPLLLSILASSTTLAAEFVTASILDGPFLWRCIGALAGSCLAFTHLNKSRNAVKMISMVFSGWVVGMLTADWVQETMEWTDEPDHWVNSAAPGGVFGWIFLTAIYSKRGEWLVSLVETFIDWVNVKFGKRQP